VITLLQSALPREPPRLGPKPTGVPIGRIGNHDCVPPRARDSRTELSDSSLENALRAYGITGVMLPRYWIPADRRAERWKRVTLIGAGAVAMLVVSAACVKGDTGREDTAGQTTSATATASTTMPPAGTEAHNNADVWFVRHMIPHHRQAIEMSDMLLAKQGIDPRVTELANTIKAAESPEIQQMQDWLKQWGEPMPAMTPGDMQGPAEGVIGQLSERELNALGEAEGADASRLFLTQMIAHHEGALSVAQTEIEEGQYPLAVAMARSIASTQQQGIDTIKGILASL
jgi:uncharacterized protein (DUF305 family)